MAVSGKMRAYMVAAVFGALSMTKLSSFDVWIHLSVGREIVRTGQIPEQNLFSFTEPDHPYKPHQWLFQVLVYGVSKAGVEALILLKAFVVGVSFFVLIDASYRRESTLSVIFLALSISYCAMEQRFVVRPQAIAFLMICFYLWVMERWSRSPFIIVWLLPVQVLWSNFHGSSVLGVLIVVAYMLGMVWRGGVREVKRYALLVPALSLASCLNPQGWSILLLPFGFEELHRMTGMKEIFVERMPIRFRELGSMPFFCLVMLVSFGAIAQSLKERRLEDVLLLSGGVLLAFVSRRFVEVAGAFFVLPAVNFIANAEKKLRSWKGFVVAGMGLVGVMLLVSPQERGLGLKRGRYPVEEVNWVCRSTSGEVRVFNEPEYGGLVVWMGDGRLKVFADSRGLASYSGELFTRFWEARSDKRAWEEILDTYPPELAIVSRAGFIERLAESDGWRLCYWGRVAKVYARRGGSTLELYERGYNILRGRLSSALFEESDTGLVAEIRRALGTAPDDPKLLLALSYFCIKARDFKGAEKLLVRLCRQHPGSATPYRWLGMVSTALERPERGIRAYRRAFRLAKPTAEDLNNLGTLYAQKGDYKRARELWLEALKITPDYQPAILNLERPRK